MKTRSGKLGVVVPVFLFGTVKALVLSMIISVIAGLVRAAFGGEFTQSLGAVFKITFVILEFACLGVAIWVAKAVQSDDPNLKPRQ